MLAPPLAAFAIEHPGLVVEILADSRLYDLQRREADLVLRFVPFSGSDIVQRRFARVRYGLYAASGYLDRCGDPRASSDGEGHRLVTMNSALDRLPDVAWLRDRWPAAAPSFRSNNREAQGAACVAGAGLAILPRVIGDQLPLVRLDGETPPSRDLWLGYHQDLRRLRRLRLLVDALSAALPPEL